MRIGIDASRAFIKERTGIEEYAYQLIKHFPPYLQSHEVVLYTRGFKPGKYQVKDFQKELHQLELQLPEHWQIREVPFTYFWTQIGLAWEMAIDPVDALFVPAHTIPWIHPQNSVVTVHGLEYEHCPESYPPFSRFYHRLFVKNSCRWASKVVAVSKNTKKDLVEMYQVPSEKIAVVYNGFDDISAHLMSKAQAAAEDESYLLFIGRLEKRKNIETIAKAFDILKQKYAYPGRLLLVGNPGCGYEEIKATISTLPSRYDIVEMGYVSKERKASLFANADIFLFPSLCEGFGLPILEAQHLGAAVITSNIGPLDEVAGNPEILVDPHDPESIAAKANEMLTNKTFRQDIINKGKQNVYRFSWDQAAKEIAELLTNTKILAQSENIIKIPDKQPTTLQQ